MSLPTFTHLGVPPLPPGWTEHVAPGGHAYYYNAQTGQSTYTRPAPSYAALAASQAQNSKKKEKPLLKKQIPGTDWLRITTTEGNIFYFNKPEKQSVWIAPDGLQDILRAVEQQEEEEKAKAHQGMLEKAAQAEKERQTEVERIKNEMKGVVKRKADEEMPLDEIAVFKKAKMEREDSESEDESSEEDEEEEWQREAAAQLAAEAEEERKRQEEEDRKNEEEEKKSKEREEEAQRMQAAGLVKMPEKVDLSIEEAKALFKTLLREKDINPLHPWDTSLPKFINDPRYVLLPSVSARREAFDEYCRERARELRESSVKKEKHSLDPKQEFDRLLEQEVKSTRTSWTDFRRTWKKDRRFYGWGRDDREREKRFRDFLKELGEKKRVAAQKAEADFFMLLKEHSNEINQNSVWKEVKKNLSHDPRYDAVGSSTLREELFNTYLKGAGKLGSTSEEKGETRADRNAALTKMERRERAVREREQKVKAELNRVEMNIERSRVGIHQEEGELDYKSMLVDAIRDLKMTWEDALPHLKIDPRFRNSPLPPNRQLQLFQSHIVHLRQKQMSNLHSLFQSHSPSLSTPFSDLPLESMLKSLPGTKLGFDIYQLEREYDEWQKDRLTAARKAFDEMLAENSFVEFWGRLSKIGGEGVDGGVKADDLGEDEGEGGGGRVDMKALAKNVDLRDMENVLKHDKRYTMFDHIPEEREGWLRDYLANLSAPKLSVHVPS